MAILGTLSFSFIPLSLKSFSILERFDKSVTFKNTVSSLSSLSSIIFLSYEYESRVPSNTPLGYLKKNEKKFIHFPKRLLTFKLKDMETKATKREVKQEVKNKVRTFATSSRSGINYIDAQKYYGVETLVRMLNNL